jgi:hypothetical protein
MPANPRIIIAQVEASGAAPETANAQSTPRACTSAGIAIVKGRPVKPRAGRNKRLQTQASLKLTGWRQLVSSMTDRVSRMGD